MNLNDLFDAIIVCNLPRRTDRLEHITNQLNKLNISFQIWPAIDHIGTDMTPIFCNVMNGRNRLLYSLWKNYSKVLLLDDDCEFVDNFYEKLQEIWPLIPNDWDLLSFGDKILDGQQINSKVYEIWESYGGHATAFNLSCAPLLFEVLKGKTFADIELNELKGRAKRYAIMPGLVGQARFESDMVGGIRPNNIYELWQ
jgi:hypothetical protein